MASSNSEAGTVWLERRAATLLGVMAGAALACVAVGLGMLWLAPARWAGVGGWMLALATSLVVLAPLVSLLGITLGALKRHRRLALLAMATLGVTLVGMGLAG